MHLLRMQPPCRPFYPYRLVEYQYGCLRRCLRHHGLGCRQVQDFYGRCCSGNQTCWKVQRISVGSCSWWSSVGGDRRCQPCLMQSREAELDFRNHQRSSVNLLGPLASDHFCWPVGAGVPFLVLAEHGQPIKDRLAGGTFFDPIKYHTGDY